MDEAAPVSIRRALPRDPSPSRRSATRADAKPIHLVDTSAVVTTLTNDAAIVIEPRRALANEFNTFAACIQANDGASSNFRTSRQRIRFIQAIYLIAFIGFFVSAGGGHGYSPKFQKYFVYLFILGLVGDVFIRAATLGARREIRAQETGRRPRWPFRYISRLTEGLQGQRLMSFIGGIRQQPRFSTRGFSATVPMVRLSVFSNGVRLGPSSSLLSMSVITWEARFDELDVIQAIGR